MAPQCRSLCALPFGSFKYAASIQLLCPYCLRMKSIGERMGMSRIIARRLINSMNLHAAEQILQVLCYLQLPMTSGGSTACRIRPLSVQLLDQDPPLKRFCFIEMGLLGRQHGPRLCYLCLGHLHRGRGVRSFICDSSSPYPMQGYPLGALTPSISLNFAATCPPDGEAQWCYGSGYCSHRNLHLSWILGA